MNQQITPTLTVESGWNEAEIHNYRLQFDNECKLPNSQPVSIFFWRGLCPRIERSIKQAIEAGHFVVINPFSHYLSRATRRKRGTLRITSAINMQVIGIEARGKRRIVINERSEVG